VRRPIHQPCGGDALDKSLAAECFNKELNDLLPGIPFFGIIVITRKKHDDCGSHRRGLASLRPSRPLHNDPGGSPQLVRPLLNFCRDDTARICHSRGLPVWLDSSNDDRRYGRNRLRAEVLPVLEALYPGAQRRMSLQAERLAQEDEQHQQLVALALGTLEQPGPMGPGLNRHRLGRLAEANQRALIQHWLRQQGPGELAATTLEILLGCLAPEQGPGQMNLASGWRLGWDRSTLNLIPPAIASP